MLQISYKYRDYHIDYGVFITGFINANVNYLKYWCIVCIEESVFYYYTKSIVYINNGKNTDNTIIIKLKILINKIRTYRLLNGYQQTHRIIVTKLLK